MEEKKEGLVPSRNYIVVDAVRGMGEAKVIHASSVEEAAEKYTDIVKRECPRMKIIPMDEVPLYEVKKMFQAALVDPNKGEKE